MTALPQRGHQEDGTPKTAPVTEPRVIGMGHPEFHFVQAVMELRTAMHQMDTDNKVAMAKIETKLDGLKSSVDGTKKNVDDLVQWKTLILGGAVVLGAVMAMAWGAYVKFGDRISIAPAPNQVMTPVTVPVSAPQTAPKR